MRLALYALAVVLIIAGLTMLASLSATILLLLALTAHPAGGPSRGVIDYLDAAFHLAAPMLFVIAGWLWAASARRPGRAVVLRIGALVLFASVASFAVALMIPVLRGTDKLDMDVADWALWLGSALVPAGAWILAELLRTRRRAQRA